MRMKDVRVKYGRKGRSGKIIILMTSIFESLEQALAKLYYLRTSGDKYYLLSALFYS